MQILYINFAHYAKVKRDTSICPIVMWDTNKIRVFMKWIVRLGSVGNDKIHNTELKDK